MHRAILIIPGTGGGVDVAGYFRAAWLRRSGLARQIKTSSFNSASFQDYANRRQCEIAGVYHDTMSGASASRPGLNQLMDDARAPVFSHPQ